MKTAKSPEPNPQTFSNDDLPTIFKDAGLAQVEQNTAFEKITKAGSWLPRIQLFGANSKQVKAKKIPMANYGVIRDSADNPEDLGEEFEGVIITWRSKAMRVKDDTILSYYDTEAPEFMAVMSEADVKDSGCFYGPEYLLWVPRINSFATFFCNSKTSRREAKNSIQKLLTSFATFKSHLIETAQYSWYGPKVFACSNPVQPMFTKEQLTEEVTKFKNPPKNTVEVDKDATTTVGRER